jgi:hypothetical protein
VGHNGDLYAKNAIITGGSLNINNNFIVDANGNLTLNGNITWGASSSPSKAVYARAYISKPANNTTNFDSSSSTTWHTTFDSSNDKFASYSHDGGATWTDTVRIVGEIGASGAQGATGAQGASGASGAKGATGAQGASGASGAKGATGAQGASGASGAKGATGASGAKGATGATGAKGATGSDATVNATNVFNALTSNGTKFGCFTTGTDNNLYINANYIKSGTLLVGEDSKPIFKAVAGTSGSVQIGGWTVDQTSIRTTSAGFKSSGWASLYCGGDVDSTQLTFTKRVTLTLNTNKQYSYFTIPGAEAITSLSYTVHYGGTVSGGWGLTIDDYICPCAGNQITYSYKPVGSFPASIDVTFTGKYIQTVKPNFVVFPEGTVWAKDSSDKLAEIGGKGGLRVIDLEAPTSSYVCCSLYSAYKIYMGYAPTKEDAMGGANITNTHTFTNMAALTGGAQNHFEVTGTIRFTGTV